MIAQTQHQNYGQLLHMFLRQLGTLVHTFLTRAYAYQTTGFLIAPGQQAKE